MTTLKISEYNSSLTTILYPDLMTMTRKFSILATVSSSLTAALLLSSVSSAIAQEKTSYVGPSIGFSGGETLYGINGKVKVADSISIRPFLQFSSRDYGPVNASITLYGAAATYDFSLPSSGFNPYAGIGYLGATGSASFQGITYSATDSGVYFEVGSDYSISDSIALNANYKFKDSGYFSFGGG